MEVKITGQRKDNWRGKASKATDYRWESDSHAEFKNTLASETIGMKFKEGANLLPQQTLSVWFLPQTQILGKHPYSSPRLSPFPQHHVTQNTCLERSIISTSQSLFLKAKEVRFQKQWLEKNTSTSEICIFSHLTSVPFHLEYQHSTSDRTECSLQHHPPGILQPKNGYLAHTFSP
jgi:hypothetical protein